MTDNNAADLHEKGKLACVKPGFHVRMATQAGCVRSVGKVQRVSDLGLFPDEPLYSPKKKKNPNSVSVSSSCHGRESKFLRL